MAGWDLHPLGNTAFHGAQRGRSWIRGPAARPHRPVGSAGVAADPARPVRIGSRSGPPTAAARPVRRPVAAGPDRPVRRRRSGWDQMGQGGINGIKPLSGTLKPTEVPAAHRHGSAARRRACSRRPDPVRSDFFFFLSIRSDPVGGRSTPSYKRPDRLQSGNKGLSDTRPGLWMCATHALPALVVQRKKVGLSPRE